MKTLKIISLAIALTMSSASSAGIINAADETFVDTTTGLQWMDFGVNNQHTYTEVSSMLVTTYSGWQLADMQQVIELWDNMLAPLSTDVNRYDTGAEYSNYSGAEPYTGLKAIIGENTPNMSLGWFADNTGSMSYAYSDMNGYAHVMGRNSNYDSYKTNTNERYSTFLVRSANVPEPSTLAIFALGMIGLASRRFKKKS
ncbi:MULTISPECIES: PEP-CTERM sorting domain-containing protein [unclassified Colwellia]|uniref:PEP-CTERM sorting domain-containing protein n=1 Tax=unclassified Colwellia TaxID=196834 RepID=UPI002175471A|nr:MULTISPECIES: PEP-CTERM sorting domain-containing protein [unclassified Colwellia]